jgi:hypothetical protein
MSRNICILLVAALFVFAQGSEFQRLALNQGRVNLRSLATTDSTEKVSLDSYNENFAVFVNLGEEYLKNNSLTLQNQTDMTVLLYSNVTSFCKDCSDFVNYNCTGNSCSADTDVEVNFMSPYFYYRKANPINQSVSIGNTTTPSWKLSNNASFFTSYYKDYNIIHRPGANRYYFTNSSTYGLLGLGVGGGAASNFRGDHPLFSVSLNSTGFGSLIFGKDSTLYDSSKTPMTLTTDTNWTMVTKNLTFGGNYTNTSFASTLIFDLQHPGISIPDKYWNDYYNPGDFYKTLRNKFNLSSYTEDNYYTYYGNLTDLPNLVFGLENGKNLTIPPAGYTRKSTRYNNTYVILIEYVNTVTNISDSSKKIDYTILGWPVLSQFYTIFEQKTGAEPTITLYPAKGSGSSSDNSSNGTPTSLGTRAIQLAVVVILLAVIYTCLKNRAAAKLQNELGEQLNRKASAF